jgi:2-hydroxy-3-keto-5-methylthiopentenyl-1-phosphate phosphatase
MIKIFIDFDGTITSQDVGDVMFETFGGVERCREIVRRYRDGEISAVDCFRQESEACSIVDKTILDGFLDRQRFDETFSEFVQFCRDKSLEWHILSDGMDYYIRRILGRMGLHNASFFANTLELVSVDGSSSKVRFEPAFPFRDETCDRCACCKRNHILTLSADDDIIVYIGEGYSDRCPARYADVVFAKDDLLTYCQRENISCYEYTNFSDVVQRMSKLLCDPSPKRGLRKRRQATVARCDVYLGG